MMQLLETLKSIWKGIDYPFLIHGGRELRFSDIAGQQPVDLSAVRENFIDFQT